MMTNIQREIFGSEYELPDILTTHQWLVFNWYSGMDKVHKSKYLYLVRSGISLFLIVHIHSNNVASFVYTSFSKCWPFLKPPKLLHSNTYSPYLAESMRPGSKLSDFQGRLFIIGFLVLVRRQMMVTLWTSWKQERTRLKISEKFTQWILT